MDAPTGGGAIGAAGNLITGLLDAEAKRKEKMRERAMELQKGAFESEKEGVSMLAKGQQDAFSNLMAAYKSALVGAK